MSIGEPLRPGDPARVGPYDLLARLGEGGMGAVYLGRSPGGRLLAIKVIHRRYGADPEYHARFTRELAAARKVTGAFTAPVLDADTDSATPWVASAFLPGLSLQEAVTRFGPLPPDAVRTLAAGLAEALTGIAAAGIAHRDIKPANIMLTGDGPRVIDFGIARFAEATAITAAGTLVGTPGYIAPEYLATGKSGPAGDVFALGAVLGFAATGRPPFGSGPVAARLVRAEAGEIDLDGVDDRALRELIRRCIRRDPGRRPTAAQVLGELSTAAPHGVGWLPQPVAKAVSARQKAMPRRALLAGAGLAAAAAVGGVLLWPRRDDESAPNAAPSRAPSASPSAAPTVPVRTPGNATLEWAVKIGKEQPDLTVAAGVIHCLVRGTTHGLDPRTRKVRWRRDKVNTSTVVGDRMYVATDALDVTALNAANGAERWTWRPAKRDEYSNGPVVAGSRLLCAGWSRVYVLDAATGRQLWSREQDGPVYGIGGDDTVVVVSTSDSLTALDPATGATRWGRVLACEEDVLVGAGLVHVRLQRSLGMRTLRTADGTDVWKREDVASNRRLGADGRLLYLHGPTKHIRALDAGTGRETWVAEMPGDEVALSSGSGDDTSLAGAHVCVTRIDKIVYAVDQADGAAAWMHKSDAPVAGAVVSDGARAYVGTLDGRVHALRLPERG